MNFLTTASLLDACVLAILSTGDAYGYSLTQKVGETLQTSESALYPVLRRLQKGNHLEVYDKPANGRNRRYYRITNVGRELLETYKDEWSKCKKSLDMILKGDKNNG